MFWWMYQVSPMNWIFVFFFMLFLFFYLFLFFSSFEKSNYLFKFMKKIYVK